LRALFSLLPLLPLFAACTGTGSTAERVQHPAEPEALVFIESLYESFDFDRGAEPDWESMRALFAEGATFVAPFAQGDVPRAVGEEAFLDDFRTWVQSEEMQSTGLHEHVLQTRVETFGVIAHAWVSFEGLLPETGEQRSVGVDSLQLVLAPEGWRLASFTTQYTREGLPLPDFLVPR